MNVQWGNFKVTSEDGKSVVVQELDTTLTPSVRGHNSESEVSSFQFINGVLTATGESATL